LLPQCVVNSTIKLSNCAPSALMMAPTTGRCRAARLLDVCAAAAPLAGSPARLLVLVRLAHHADKAPNGTRGGKVAKAQSSKHTNNTGLRCQPATSQPAPRPRRSLRVPYALQPAQPAYV
jgi:hypothetical protein